MPHVHDKQPAPLKSAHWFQDPANLFLMGVVLAIGCLYLIYPLIELLQPR